jgi:hypothetical protein
MQSHPKIPEINIDDLLPTGRNDIEQSIFQLNCLCNAILAVLSPEDQRKALAEYDRLISEQSLRPSDDQT